MKRFLCALLLVLFALFAPFAFAQVGGPGGVIGSSIVNPAITLNLNYAGGTYYWNGTTTLASSTAVSRADSQLAYAPRGDGTWAGFAHDTARVTAAGLFIEPTTTNRLLWNNDLTNVAWTNTNVTISSSTNNPFSPSTDFNYVELGAGATTLTMPAGAVTATTQLHAYACGSGGNGAAGTANTNSGGGAGGGGYSDRLTNITVAANAVLAVTVGTGGGTTDTTLKDSTSTTTILAGHGGNASGVTAGARGGNAGPGQHVSAGGAGNNGANAAASRGGGGAGGSGGADGVGGVAGAGNTIGGGGGSAADAGSAGAAASGTAGGAGGNNHAGTGGTGGTGGTATVAAVGGTLGGGSGGGLAAVGINGASTTSNAQITITDSNTGQTYTLDLGSGGGGGGGLAAGAGGNGGVCGGGGGGGESTLTAGTGGSGGNGKLIVTYFSNSAVRLTAGAANATLKQTYTAGPVNRTASIVMRPITVTGAVYLSQDNCVTLTDISGQLVSGKFNQVFAPYDSQTNPTWCLRIANSGDVVDVMPNSAQLEDNPFPTTPIPTRAAAATRNADVATLNLGSFSAFVTNASITVLAAVKPGSNGTSIAAATTTNTWTFADIGGTTSGLLGDAGIIGGSQLARLTVSNTGTSLSYAINNPTTQFSYGACNRLGFSSIVTPQSGAISLSGDSASSTTQGSWADPTNFTTFRLGSTRSGTNPVVGPILQLIVLGNTAWTAAQIAAWTLTGC